MEFLYTLYYVTQFWGQASLISNLLEQNWGWHGCFFEKTSDRPIWLNLTNLQCWWLETLTSKTWWWKKPTYTICNEIMWPLCILQTRLYITMNDQILNTVVVNGFPLGGIRYNIQIIDWYFHQWSGMTSVNYTSL